jgi:hypothetical protein
MTLEPFAIVLVLAVVLILAGVSVMWRSQRIDTLLRTWADENGYRLISAEYCWFWKVPYWFSSSKSQAVYRVQVEDQAGQVRGGYVRLGGWFLGLWSDAVDVTWD